MGIGKGCALMLAKAGADIAAVDIDKASCQKTAAEIKSLGRKSASIIVNLRQDEDIDRMLAQTWKALGRLDICVNNVGGLGGVRPMPFLQATPDWVDHLLDQNLRTTFLCCLAQAKFMVEHHIKGRIINISSTGAMRVFRNTSAYSAAKAGIISLTQNMALDLSPHGIRVNSIAPATTATERVDPDSPYFREVARVNPMGRLARPEDMGGVAVFLASELSSYVNGQVIAVDGGATCASIDPPPKV